MVQYKSLDPYASLHVVPIAFAMLCGTLNEQVHAQWTRLDGPYGARVNDVAEVGAAVWAATAAGMHQSFDLGHTWSQTTTLSAEDLLDILVDGDTVAVLSLNAIYLSLDGGQNWQVPIALPDCGGEPPSRLRPLGSRWLLDVGTCQFLSTDLGQNWTASSLRYLRVIREGAIAMEEGSVPVAYFYEDATTGFVTPLIFPVPVSDFAINNAKLFAGPVLYLQEPSWSASPVLRSADLGASWQPVHSAGWPYGMFMGGVGDTLFLGGADFTAGDVVRSLDNGLTWAPHPGYPVVLRVTGIRDRVDLPGGVYLTGGGGGIMEWLPGATDPVYHTQGLCCASTFRLFHAGATLVSTTLFRTQALTASGNWQTLCDRGMLDLDQWNGSYTALTMAFSDQPFLQFQHAQDDILDLGQVGSGGLANPFGFSTANAVYQPSGALLWHNGGTGLFRSMDHGASSISFNPPEPIQYARLAQHGDKTFLLNNATGNIWRLHLGQWSLAATGAQGGLFVSGGRIVMVSNAALRWSVDEGDTWFDAPGAGLPVNDLGYPVFPGKLLEAGGSWYGIVNNTIYRSMDAGDTWEALPAIPFPDARDLVIVNGYLYCGSEDRGIWRFEEALAMHEKVRAMGRITAYPVPATDQVSFIVPADVRVATIRVMDAHGRLVMSFAFMGDRPDLSIEGLPSGPYHAVLLDAAGTPLGRSRFVKAY